MVSEHASPLAALGGSDAGGQNVHVGALAATLTKLGDEVVVHTRRDSADLPATVGTPAGVVVDHVPAGPCEPVARDDMWPLMPDLAEGLRARWEADRPDVVHAHFWMSGAAALAAARPLGIPVVQTFHALGAVKRRHQGTADSSPAARLAVEANLVAHVDQVIATCHDEVRELEAIADPAAPVAVIACGVDTDRFRPGPPEGEARRARHRLVVVGRLVPRKGTDVAIRALAGLPDTELLVVGGPSAAALDVDPEVGRLRRLASEAGVADRVRFLGQVAHERVPGLIRSADAVVCVPRYEPFGLVALEAMACGVPAVVSRVGGLQESIVDGETGVHVPPDDPGALAARLGRLLADPAAREAMGRAGLARVECRYTWLRVAAATQGTYREVLTRHRSLAAARR
jgi:D-inositol-3-phosphate glycosyltransferase